MGQRGITAEAIEAVLEFGRAVHARGAVVHAIGKKEVAHYLDQDIDLSAFDGIHVVCAGDGTIITAYRNHDFRRLRAGLGRGRFNPKRRGY
jgi:hypothetical protein